jgi:hypothetical protein
VQGAGGFGKTELAGYFTEDAELAEGGVFHGCSLLKFIRLKQFSWRHFF